MSSKTLRASEIGQFRFCERAWWYARSGKPSTSMHLLESGSKAHRSHIRKVRRWMAIQRLGLGVMLAGLMLLLLQLASGHP